VDSNLTLVFAVVAVALSAAVLALLLRRADGLPQATPNARSLHARPVPRVGGLAIWAGALPAFAVVAVTAPLEAVGWVPAWMLLLLVSLRDDVRGLAIPIRLVAHGACAIWFALWVVPAGEAGAGFHVAQILAAALLVAWSLNLYNFMDGSDGMAALMTIAGFAAYGMASTPSSTTGLASFAVAFAALPFLVVNRPPARIFMGDVGAVPLGFLAAALGLAGVVHGLWGAWFPTLVFLPFVADATLTLVRRAWRRERWWEGHRSHYYQRLHQLGAGHAGTLAVYAALILGTSVTAVLCARMAPEWGWRVLLAWCAVLALPFGAIDYHWARKSTGTP
jgi:UDP-N-acetylmuramyl pentapeptide phosphotransferase/UDP-N-acetylglucosamine-1-phosphate transferase